MPQHAFIATGGVRFSLVSLRRTGQFVYRYHRSKVRERSAYWINIPFYKTEIETKGNMLNRWVIAK
ncbi:hypothetical protein LZZ85_15570 [Terrimonas sp. NA20]|uniref:Uncharacterized protein n=1 Tax=Terrimonas ginsenosidimutans TaxID=2908004 RepID=A0ABS9KTW4_9BACT|nr:hypothetical protein [Terrimonas ginsenosidimutans]MCG2615718.1 hypothetical protein [Terrimonas ginsenosidimutans]